MSIRTFYIPDWRPQASDVITTRLYLYGIPGGPNPLEVIFQNGTFTTDDVNVQAALDAQPGLCTQQVWQSFYRNFPKRAGSARQV